MDNPPLGTSLMTSSMVNGMRLTGASNFPQKQQSGETEKKPLIPPSVLNNEETIQHSTMEVEEALEELRIQPIPIVVNDGFKLPIDNEEDDHYILIDYEYQDDEDESS